MFMDKVKNFCDHSMILWELASNRNPIGSFWTPPASFRVNKATMRKLASALSTPWSLHIRLHKFILIFVNSWGSYNLVGKVNDFGVKFDLFTPGLSEVWDQNWVNSALYIAIRSVEPTAYKNVIVENIHWALSEDAEVAEVKRPRNSKRQKFYYEKW